MRRRVFEQVEVEGFESSHVEALSLQAGGSQGRSRLYAGTLEGQLTVYDCLERRGGSYELGVAEVLRSGSSRDRKAVSQLEVLESVVVALIDGVPTVYDAATLRATATAREVRGCQLFCAHAPSRTLVLFAKKRARVFGWHRGGALRDTRREYTLAEAATAACCVSEKAVVLATRREYSSLRLMASEPTTGGAVGGGPAATGLFRTTVGSAFSSLGASGTKADALGHQQSDASQPEPATRRLCEAAGGAGVAVVVAGSQSRPSAKRLLTSSGARGVLFDASALSGGPLEDRLTWSSPPSQSRAASAFIVSLVGAKRIEIHFAPSLALVQTVDLDFKCTALCGGGAEHGPSQLDSTAAASGDFSSAQASSLGAEVVQHEFFAAGDARCRCLRMVPVRQQIGALVDEGSYEDALALCAACRITQRGGAYFSREEAVDVAAIEERYAYALYSRGDFEGAVHHWLAADAAPANVAALFPALCPPGLQAMLASRGEDEDASPEKREALRHPPQLRQASLSRAAAAVTRFLEVARERALADEPPRRREADDGASLDESLKLVDTVLVSARLHCSPPRVGDVVDLLKAPDQRCELESVAPLLAAGGPAYAEPLLWLYRSKGQHSRALSMLVEERCCGPPDAGAAAAEGAWDRWRFRRWKARYLRSLWFSGDPRLAALALDAAGSLFDVAPTLGLAVFTGATIERPGDPDDDRAALKRHAGGAGTPARDVVAWMKKLELSSDETLDELVLDSGNAVAIAYLDFLVARGERLEILHNELAYLLLDGLLEARDAAGANPREEPYRNRLRSFLSTSRRYKAETVLSWLPDDLPREKALVLARLRRHDEVLRVYADDLRDDALAEAYCAQVWEQADARRMKRLAARPSDAPEIEDRDDEEDDDEALDVYLRLARRYVQQQTDTGLEKAMSVVSRNVSRVDPVAALDLLPDGLALARVADFVARLFQLAESGRRDAQVEHQLLRVHYVDLKYELTQQQLRQQSKISAVPELARLGKLKRSLDPVVLSDDATASNAPEPYDVTCVPHVFEGHVALQFRVTNNAPGHRLQNVRVKVESLGDADLYAHDAEVPLKVLPFQSTGSCYVVFRTFPTVGTVVTSFANELRFAVLPEANVRASPNAAPHTPTDHDSFYAASYLEEIPLQNLELSTADM